MCTLIKNRKNYGSSLILLPEVTWLHGSHFLLREFYLGEDRF